MAKVILDTSFILSAVKNKLDFFEELFHKGHSVFIPKEVVFEIERIKESTKSLKTRTEAEIASRILKKGHYREVGCPGKYPDAGIKNFLKEHPEFVLATMDSTLKRSVKNRRIIIRNKKKLELQ